MGDNGSVGILWYLPYLAKVQRPFLVSDGRRRSFPVGGR